ncbi:MAG: MATE family efflux transporter [Prevotella sp.]|nr:MATE family efflux transporter [Prevotella sp.]MCM1075240.1 MATE family efflux transporter [Ruminococcus sp.]
MKNNNSADRLKELANAPLGKLLWKYSLPAVIGTVVTALYNLIDSIVIGHAIDDPNVIAGIAVTFPVMTLSGALGMLIGAGAATRISIVLGQKDKPRAEHILGNSVMLTIIIGIIYMTCFFIFLDPILRTFGASDASLPYAYEFMQWIIPGMVLINLTFSYNNVMRATGYPRKAMLTNILGALLNAILAPIFLFGLDWGIWGAALATDISMAITAFFVLSHFFNPKNELTFKPHTTKLQWPIVKSIIMIGMAPFLINLANAGINALMNNSLLHYGGDNAIAAIVAFNRYVTVFVMIVIGICQGMQPILGYNYGAGKYKRLFKTLTMAASAGFIVTTVGAVLAHLFPEKIAGLFMQDEAQINAAVTCLSITTLSFWMVGFQIVSTNFFQSLGMAGKAIFLSLTRQIIFMIPLIYILPPIFGLKGIWSAFPISDAVATIVTICMLIYQIRVIHRQANPAALQARK